MKSYFPLVVLSAFSLFIFSACLKTPEPQPCTYDACAVKAPAAEIARVQAYIDSMQIAGTTQHCSGIFYKIETPGTGRTPEVCDYVAVKYKGKFTNGNTFDSSNAGIDLSLSRVIRGWSNGVPLIKEGGKITLFIPPSLGYGPNPYQSIPGNSILVFDVELIGVY